MAGRTCLPFVFQGIDDDLRRSLVVALWLVWFVVGSFLNLVFSSSCCLSRAQPHWYRFNGDGKCVDIPYSESIPSVARTKSWVCCERNGGILVWHHAEDEPPSWEIPVIEVLDERW
jgi:hypothetical protein